MKISFPRFLPPRRVSEQMRRGVYVYNACAAFLYLCLLALAAYIVYHL